MKKTIMTILLCACATAAPIHQKKPKEMVAMEQLTRIGTSNLQGDFRVVFALDEPLVGTQASERLPTWVVTVERFPAGGPKRRTRYLPEVFVDPPPCELDACAIQDIHGDVVFHGRFVLGFSGSTVSFSGSQESTRAKLLTLTGQLKNHPEWTKADLAAALASSGAKYGPDKEKEFKANLPLKALESIWGPLRVDTIAQIEPGHRWAGYWRVRLALLRDPRTRVVMRFEPFEGQLQELGVFESVRTVDPKTGKYKWTFPEW